jgi:hypothetical protein
MIDLVHPHPSQLDQYNVHDIPRWSRLIARQRQDPMLVFDLIRGLVVKEEFFRFLHTPCCATFVAVLACVASSEKYNPLSDELERANEFLDAGKLDEARSLLRESMPNLLLSPGAHSMLAYIAEQVGDDQTAEMEGKLAATCAEGVLATGDGSNESPYLVLRISDEHDVIAYLGKEFESQSLVEDGERHLDRVRCTDGSELWFDVTQAFRWRQQQEPA